MLLFGGGEPRKSYYRNMGRKPQHLRGRGMINIFLKKKDTELEKAKEEIIFLRKCLQELVDSDSSAVPGGYHETLAEKYLKESLKRYPWIK